MIVIDLSRIREALPKRAKVTLGKTKDGCPYIKCIVKNPSLYAKGSNDEEKEWKMVLNWQEQIIGKENISEFYVEETGSYWYVYLKRVPMEFSNAEDEDINSFVSMNLVKDGKLIQQ